MQTQGYGLRQKTCPENPIFKDQFFTLTHG
jgi:hypothetical protein